MEEFLGKTTAVQELKYFKNMYYMNMNKALYLSRYKLKIWTLILRTYSSVEKKDLERLNKKRSQNSNNCDTKYF